VVGLVALAGVWAVLAAAGAPGDPTGAMAAPLSLPDLDGRTRALREFLSPRPVLLEFMSTSCPHCRYMGPVLTRLHAAYGERVTFVTVAIDRDPMHADR